MTDKNIAKPITLIILDGWGHSNQAEHNAIAGAKTPFFDMLMQKYPHTLLNASEEHVGLPIGTIGNSEVGHMTIGAGKTIDTDLVKISKAIAKEELLGNLALAGLFDHIKKYNSTLHILGLVSDGGVHSHQEHLYALLKTAKQAGLTKIIIHAFTDGRDVAPQSAGRYLKELEKVISNAGIGFIATATGRYFAMDRDQNWERTKKAEDAIFHALGREYKNQTPSQVVEKLYKEGIIDELLEPMIFLDDQGKAYPVNENDGVFLFNFRSDRPRQLARKIAEHVKTKNLYFATMTEYDPGIESEVAFPQTKIETTLAAEISRSGLAQSHIAETEKYAHVTFFFNGGRQEPHENERHFLIESRKDVATHDLAPEMRAREIADKAIERVKAGDDFILINFANADMVGHTANREAIIKAVETVDRELKRVVEAVIEKNGIAVITADHGNAEVNVDETTGEKHTAHTLNLVPFIIASNNLVIPSESDEPRNPLTSTDKRSLHSASDAFGLGRDDKMASGTLADIAPTSAPPPLARGELRGGGTLADIAPTILDLMAIKKPSSMTGKSLIQKQNF